MICPIVTSPVLLQIPSTNATQADRSVGENLKETLQAHAHECVGMAANMIGVHHCRSGSKRHQENERQDSLQAKRTYSSRANSYVQSGNNQIQ